MLPTTLLTTISIVTLSSAFPVTEKRVCGSVLLPTTLVELHESNPNFAYTNTGRQSQAMLISQSLGPTGVITDRVSELVGFSGPVGGYGCTLGITFPADYTFPTLNGATPTLNVYKVAEPLPGAPTWNNVKPTKGPLFGTVTVGKGVSAVINSESCPTAQEGGLAFVFEYADWVQGAGSVGWTNYVNGLNGAGLRGVYLNYNC